MAQSQPYVATVNELKQLATIFSRIVDAKSPVLAEHSLGVAGWRASFAEKLGVSAENCDKIENCRSPARHRQTARSRRNPRQAGQARRARAQKGHEHAQFRDLPDPAHGSRASRRSRRGPRITMKPRRQRLSLPPPGESIWTSRHGSWASPTYFQAMVQDRPYRQGLVRRGSARPSCVTGRPRECRGGYRRRRRGGHRYAVVARPASRSRNVEPSSSLWPGGLLPACGGSASLPHSATRRYRACLR